MKKAYSLLELSIVTIIIGVLISGVLAGVGMIKTSKMSNARLHTTKSVVPEISGLVAWYEVSLRDSIKGSEAIDGGAITSWYDSTPGSNSNIYLAAKKNELISTSPGVTFIANGINGTPSIKFSGAANAKMTITNAGSSTNFAQGSSLQSTVFLVFRPLSAPTSTAQVMLDSGAAGSPTASIGIKSTAVALNATTAQDIAGTFSVSNDYIVAAYFNGTTSQAFINNTTAAGSANIGTNQLTGLTIGTDKAGAVGFNGLISEIIVYNRPLKLQERKDVMGYLSKKYKISVTGL